VLDTHTQLHRHAHR